MAFRMKGFNPGEGTGMNSAFKSNDDETLYHGGMLPEVEVTDKHTKKSRRLAEERELKEKLYQNPVIKSAHRATDKASDIIKTAGSETTQAMFPFAGIIGKGAKGVKAIKGSKGAVSKFGSKIKNLFKGKKKSIEKPKSKILPDSKIPHYGKVDYDKSSKILDATRARGKAYDIAYTKNPKGFLDPKNFKEVKGFGGKGPGTPGYRKVVEFNPGGGLQPQRFYRSAGLGDKGVDKFGRSLKKPGHWTPLEGFADLLPTKKNPKGVKDWTIKTEGWDKGYDSKLFENLGNMLENNIIIK